MVYKFTASDDKYITDNYKSKTIKEIANCLNLTYSQVRHRIERHLKITPSKRKKHYHNEAFFKEDSRDKYYVLGLVSADGNLYNDNYKNKYKVSISLHYDDISLLKNINNLICNTNLISTRKNNKMSELVLYNEVIYNEIKKNGITERKSLSIKFPNIPKEYIKDFIRGYFDGDGSLTVSKIGNYKKLTIQFLGTYDFLKGINNTINKELNISIKNITNTKSKIKCLRYYTLEAEAVLDWLYEDSCNNLKLYRKYNKYISYKKRFND